MRFPRMSVRQWIIAMTLTAVAIWSVQTARRWQVYASKASFHGQRLEWIESKRKGTDEIIAIAEDFLRTEPVYDWPGYDRFQQIRSRLYDHLDDFAGVTLNERAVFMPVHRRGVFLYPEGRGPGWEEICRGEMAEDREILRKIKLAINHERMLLQKYQRAASRPWQVAEPDNLEAPVTAKR